jgi:hypothetical protein
MLRLIGALKQYEPIFRRSALIALLYLVLPFQALFPVEDPDIWWHLRTGDWITRMHQLPYVDPFSGPRSGSPWIAYSWSFELLVHLLHARFGLLGLVWFTTAMAVLITFVAHRLMRRGRVPFALEILVTSLALFALKGLMSPRPWLFTIVFFCLELIIISRTRVDENTRWVWLLPLVFILWANIHIQFTYGLAVLGLLFIETALGYFGVLSSLKIQTNCVQPKRLFLVIALCLLATLVTPYNVTIYRPLIEYAVETGVFQRINELLPMSFRTPDNWVVLFLTFAAVFALARDRTLQLFPVLLLVMGAFLGFRARRDAWLLVLTDLWILAERLPTLPAQDLLPRRAAEILISGTIAVVGLAWVGIHRQIKEDNLATVVAQKYPVKAVQYVKANQSAGPLFNDFDWGGFLIWSLPELPVSIDGRTNLYGDKAVERSINTWGAQPGWDSDPDLLRAGVIIAEKERALTALLRLSPKYEIVYEDATAAVFVPASRK